MNIIEDVVEIGQVYALPSGPLQVRNNCKLGRWMLDTTRDIGGAGLLRAVVIGYETLYGFVPRIPNQKKLDEALAQKSIDVTTLSVDEKIRLAFDRCGEHWACVLFVILPGTKKVEPEYTGVLCSTLVKSTGLYKPVTGFLGNGGYLDTLFMQGQRPQDMITTMAIEVTHKAPDSSDCMGVTWKASEPKSDEEADFIAKVQTMLPAWSRSGILEVPGQILESCVPTDYNDVESRQKAVAASLIQNFAWHPNLRELIESRTVDILPGSSEYEDAPVPADQPTL